MTKKGKQLWLILFLLMASRYGLSQAQVYTLESDKIHGMVPPASEKYIIVCNGYKSDQYVLCYKNSNNWDTLKIAANHYIILKKKSITSRMYFSTTDYTEVVLRSNNIYSLLYDRPNRKWVIMPTIIKK